MKILLVSLFLPRERAFHAGSRYVFELIRQLSGKHEIHLATRLEEKELPYLASLKPLCREIYPYTYRTDGSRGLFDIAGLILNYAGFSRYAGKLARGGAFDLVHVEWVEAGFFMSKGRSPMVLGAHDVITKPAERLMEQGRGVRRRLLSLRYRSIRALELRTVRKFDTVFTLSEYDRNYLLHMEPGLKVKTAPVPAGMGITSRKVGRDKNMILFLASYRYRKVNVDAALYFCREVLPLIRKSIPGARFIIAGYGPPEELTSLHEKEPDVLVPGFVEDIDECYKKAAVFVAPILVGGGIIVKILDAMAAATPVVTTSYGNEGIGAVPGRDLLVADDPKSFAESVIRVLSDREYADSLGRSGQEFVRKNYAPDAMMNAIESVYEELVGNRQ
jgi:glycosyltransferase involved in cell wall biosynthesis